MKRFLLTLIVVVVLAASVVGIASAQGGTTEVYPYEDGNAFTVPAGDDITVIWAWSATTRGLVKVFRNAFSANYTIYDQDGSVVWQLSAPAADQQWGPIEQVDPEEFGIKCPMPIHWLTLWTYEGLRLTPGTYTLVTEWTQSHPVNDGYHICVDAATGDPLAPPPSLSFPGSGTWTVTINVVQ